jgi:3-deoxy-D-manno-octulosonic-acid transferase
VWFHAASLGEYEQGLPVMQRFRNEHPQYKIVLTFFSPSGYEVRKDSKEADVICYLPLDSKSNVTRFLDLVQPQMVFFIKYEFWPNYLKALKKRTIPTYLISGIFSEKQLFFKWYGSFYRKCLNNITHFFVQDKKSQELLNALGMQNVTISGDTRFDRVLEILERNNQLDYIQEFVGDNLTTVVGSSWSQDEELLMSYINNSTVGVKWIFAPHNIKTEQVNKLKQSCQKSVVLFSEKEEKDLSVYDVFIIDTIGVLTKIYSYADVAYIGGGFGSGIHNVLEPATFGMPVVIGPKYQKFKEEVDLVAIGACVSVANQKELNTILDSLITDKEVRQQKSKLSQDFVRNHAGATAIVLENILRI